MQTKRQHRVRIFSIITSFLMIFSLLTPGLASAEGQKKHQSVFDHRTTTSDKVTKELNEAFKENDRVTFLIKFNEKADTDAAIQEAEKKADKAGLTSYKTKLTRNSAVLSALKTTAFDEQQNVKEYLNSQVENDEAENIKSFYIVNGMAVTATEKVAKRVAAFDEVEFVTKSETRQLIDGEEDDQAIADDDAIEWNVDRVDAPAAWESEIDGSGTVVASIDTGVQWDHPALKEKYYGYDAETGEVDHSDSWFDATGNEDEPFDDQGHGTHTIGTMVGGESDGSNQVGVAPGAKFISARAFTEEGGSDVDITDAAEWIADRADVVDVVNNSWGGGAGKDEWFMDVVDNWIALDIFPEFSAGNVDLFNPGGPGSIAAPSNYPQSFATGNTDKDDMIADSSLRGPSPYDEVKPDISAPGSGIRSSVPGDDYGSMSGTSMAGPAVSAVVALLRQADSDISVDEMKEVLTSTATPRTDDEYSEVPNNGYGHGIVNAYEAVAAVQDGLGTVAGAVESAADSQGLEANVTIDETGRSVTTDPEDGTYSLVHGAGDFTAVAEAYGHETKEQSVTIEDGETVEADFSLDELSTFEVSGTITNEATAEGIADAELHLVEDSKVEIDHTDADGNYSFDAYKGDYTLSIMADGYLSTTVDISIEDGKVTQDVELEPLYTYPGDEIGYDDGVADNASAFYDEGNGWGVKMSLPEGKDTAVVTEGVFKFWNEEFPEPGGTGFAVEVWSADEDGEADEKIAGPIDAEAVRDEEDWTVVDLSGENIIVDGDFYMVYMQTAPNTGAPGLASDETSANAERSYQYVDGAWEQTPEDEGNYMIRARVDYQVEAPSITSPEEGDFTNEDAVSVKGDASPTTEVQLTNNGDKAGETQEIGEDGSFDIDAELTEGENVLKAVTFADGMEIGESEEVTVTKDTEAPDLTIDNPVDGDATNQESVTVEGTVADDHLEQVTVNGEKADVDGEDYSKQIMLQDGSNDIEVTATDKADNETSETVSLEVVADGPELKNLKPDEDQYVTPGDKVEVSFSSDVEGGKAAFDVKLPTLNDEDANETNMKEKSPGVYKGTWTVPTNAAFEGAIIQISLTDKAGNTTTEDIDAKLFAYSEKTNRIEGELRYDTAVETSKAGWSSADTVILSRGDEYADALAGVPLAYKLDAPILLTATDDLWEATADEIDRLDAENVVILGGKDAISSSVEKMLNEKGLDVRRINGGDRFDTAALIAEEVAPDGSSEVAVANGMDFPDALSVASSAAKEGTPILLVKEDWISDKTSETIDQLGPEQTQVIGGKEVISDKIAEKLPNNNRLAGHDRYDTNIDVLNHYGVTSKHMYVATGTNFADALTGAVLAAKKDSGILLVHKRVPEVTANYITNQGTKHITTFGGDVAVDESVQNALEELLK